MWDWNERATIWVDRFDGDGDGNGQMSDEFEQSFRDCERRHNVLCAGFEISSPP